MDIQSLERQILLRHRSEGHVRFSVPPALARTRPWQLIRRRLLELDGVYRVDCFPTAHKLAIRYQSVACSLGRGGAAAARGGARSRRHRVLPAEPQQPFRAHRSRPSSAARAAASTPCAGCRPKAARCARGPTSGGAKAIGFTHYAKARVESDSRLPKGLDERTVINFLNDIAALYLVKIHWDLITKRWTQALFTYRYEWLTVFYLVFLLVRSRKQAPKK
ncbi:MAG: hypothetical protein MZW92_64060 [Comamonadaceae bacterium]|nr:hypothetical protein [Comamonadaceae bacterium]